MIPQCRIKLSKKYGEIKCFDFMQTEILIEVYKVIIIFDKSDTIFLYKFIENYNHCY